VTAHLRSWLAGGVAVVAAAMAWAQSPPPASVPAAAAASAPALQGAPLLATLQRGGYILYFRHASTDFGRSDERMTGYEDCATQRNLTDQGRAEARAIGAALRELAIPVDRVLASPFCRTLETAQLIFGRGEASPAVRGGPADAASGRYAELVALLSTPLQDGANLALVSHGNPFRAVAGGPYLAEGEAAVVEPQGTAGFRVVARVRKDEWMALRRS
jgi:phosphohistidine phosphatase SixA